MSAPLPETPGQRPPLRWVPTPTMRAAIALHVAALAAVILRPGNWPLALAAIVLTHLLLAAIGLWPRSRLLGPNLVRLPLDATRRREVVLSFDDGPDPLVTPQVLDLLDRFGAKASFFCVATRAAKQPELVREIVRRGHGVENHSDRHSNFFAFNGYGGFLRELRRSQNTLGKLSGQAPAWFRAPMGIRNPMLEPALAQAGLRYVSWTRRGYDALRGDPDEVLRRLTQNLAAGDILLLHDGQPAKTADGQPVVLAVLPRLLDRIAAQGLKAVSLTQACRDRA